MSILMPIDEDWLVSNWISFSFFTDCLPYLDKAPYLKTDIQFCINAEIDTLDLRNKNAEIIRELKMLLSSVLKDNLIYRRNEFYSPEYFPIYRARLEELDELVSKILLDKSSS